MSKMQVSAPVQRSLDRWHEMVAKADMTGLEAIVHKEAVFRSPVAHTPYPGQGAVCLILRTVMTVFEDFIYHRSFATPDGESVVLEFTAEVSGKKLTGVDVIRFDEDGLITEFMVMIRPMTGLMALADQMNSKLAHAQKTLKGGA